MALGLVATQMGPLTLPANILGSGWWHVAITTLLQGVLHRKQRLLMGLHLRHLINVLEVTRMDMAGNTAEGGKGRLTSSHPPACACSTIRSDPSPSKRLRRMVT